MFWILMHHHFALWRSAKYYVCLLVYIQTRSSAHAEIAWYTLIACTFSEIITTEMWNCTFFHIPFPAHKFEIYLAMCWFPFFVAVRDNNTTVLQTNGWKHDIIFALHHCDDNGGVLFIVSERSDRSSPVCLPFFYSSSEHFVPRFLMTDWSRRSTRIFVGVFSWTAWE